MSHSDDMRVLIFGAPWVWFDMQIIPMDQCKDPRLSYYAGNIPGSSGWETSLPEDWNDQSISQIFEREHGTRFK